jgi:hypothetical protein
VTLVKRYELQKSCNRKEEIGGVSLENVSCLVFNLENEILLSACDEQIWKKDFEN